MLHRLVRAPRQSFEFLTLRPYSPGGRFITLATGAKLKAQPPNRHRLQRGLPGYLILFAPHAFAHERQYIPNGAAFAFGIPPHLYAFHRYTWNSTPP